MAAASCMLVVMSEVPVSMMAPSALIPGTTVLPTLTPSSDTIQYLQGLQRCSDKVPRPQSVAADGQEQSSVSSRGCRAVPQRACHQLKFFLAC